MPRVLLIAGVLLALLSAPLGAQPLGPGRHMVGIPLQGAAPSHALYEFRAPAATTEVGDWYRLTLAPVADFGPLEGEVSLGLSPEVDPDGIRLRDRFWASPLQETGSTAFVVREATTFYVLVAARGASAKGRFQGHLTLERTTPNAVLEPKTMAVPYASSIRGNIVLIHGIRTEEESEPELWAPLVQAMEAEAGGRQARLAWKVWSFRYDWGDLSGDVAWNLNELLKRRPEFRGRPLLIVAHSKGGLVSKAFAKRLETGYTQTYRKVGGSESREFGAFGSGPGHSDLRIVYLDTPHRGSTMAALPASWFTTHGNWFARQELQSGLSIEAPAAVRQYVFAPSYEASSTRHVGHPVVPYASAVGVSAPQGRYELSWGELMAGKGYLDDPGDLHRSVATSPKTADLIFLGHDVASYHPAPILPPEEWLETIESGGEVERLLQAPVRHLGDDHFSTPVNVGFQKSAEGIRWSTEFFLTPGEATRTDGWLVLNLRGAEYSVLYVNGAPAGNLRNTLADNGGAQAFPLPRGVLRPGKNILMILSHVNPRDGKDNDDFEFHDVTLFFGDIRPYVRN